jgi:hypothetical protein
MRRRQIIGLLAALVISFTGLAAILLVQRLPLPGWLMTLLTAGIAVWCGVRVVHAFLPPLPKVPKREAKRDDRT